MRKTNEKYKNVLKVRLLCTYFRGQESGKRRGSSTVKFIENGWESKDAKLDNLRAERL